MEIEGYRECVCGCGKLELAYVAHQTRGLAFECWAEMELNPTLKMTEIMIRNQRMAIPTGKHRKRNNKGNPNTRRQVERARVRAMRRLKNLFPELYDVLYDQERVALGMLPVIRPQQNRLADAVKTYQESATYHAASTMGAPDDAQPVQEQHLPV